MLKLCQFTEEQIIGALKKHPPIFRQRIGILVRSRLGWGRQIGKIRRCTPLTEGSRPRETAQFGPPVDEERFYRVIDILDELATEAGKAGLQIALNRPIQHPTMSSVDENAKCCAIPA